MAVVNVSPEAHAVAKAAAERAGMSLSAWASERLAVPSVDVARVTVNHVQWVDPLTVPDMALHQRLARMALERAESPAETLAAALDALATAFGVTHDSLPLGMEQAKAFWDLCSEEGKNPESMMAKLISRWKVAPGGESVPRADVDACIERWKARVAECVEAAGAAPCHPMDAIYEIRAVARSRDRRAETPLPASHEALASEYRVKIVDSCYDGDMETVDEEGVEELLREMLARAPLGVVVPQKREARLLADGMPPCRCDGPEESGPHHRTGCERRT